VDGWIKRLIGYCLGKMREVASAKGNIHFEGWYRMIRFVSVKGSDFTGNAKGEQR
jgi:hypothetical protein